KDDEPENAIFPQVRVDRLSTLSEHILDESASRDEHVMGVADLDESADGRARHQAEGAASELQRVNVRAHRLQHVFEVPRAHWRVVRPSDFGDPSVTGLWCAVIHANEAERTLAGRGD